MEPETAAEPIAWKQAWPWVRRGLLVLFVGALLGYVFLPRWVHVFAGASDWSVLQEKPLSPAAQALVDEHLEDLQGHTLLDVHVHLAGRGLGSDCWVNPNMLSRLHPSAWTRFQTYLSAGRVKGDDKDQVFADGLLALSTAMPLPTRTHLLGFDFARGSEGVVDREGSAFAVPDGYVIEQAARGGAAFVPAPSIHPQDPAAQERLRNAAAQGARLIKWLPAAHNIDPGDPANDEFYGWMRELDLTLLVHCGSEHAVEAVHGHGLGNPLRLRRPLGLGNRIVVAHCATTGMGEDLDFPDQPAQPNHRLFLRLMDEPSSVGLLFGEISTVTQFNHFEHGLADLLARPDLHGRLVNGSDWPLPGIHILYQLGPLAKAGFLDPDQRAALKEIYEHNPLLFDLLLKRCVRHPQTGQAFSADLFVMRPAGRLPLGIRGKPTHRWRALKGLIRRELPPNRLACQCFLAG